MNSSGNSHKKILIFASAIAVAITIIALPTPEPLERGELVIPLSWSGKAVLGLLLAAILMWITEVIPFSITALLVMLVIPTLKIDTFKNIIQLGFGNQIIAFFIGVLVLSSAFTRSGMGARLSCWILKIMGTQTKMVILGFVIVGALLSMWITDMAVAAMMMPLGVGILKQAKVKPLESNFGKALMISCAWGPLIGGIATPSGCGPNPLCIGFLEKLAKINIDFLTWMSLGVPASLLMIPCGWFVLIKFFPPEIDKLPMNEQEISNELQNMGSLNPKEIWTLIIFGATICAWIASPIIKSYTQGSIDIPMQAIALAGAIALFLPGIEALDWKQAQKDIDWGGIILICAGIAMGMTIYSTGAARWLAWILLGPVVQLPGILKVFSIVLVVALLHMAFSSNTVTGTIIIPLLIALALDLKINPWIVTAPAAFTSSLAFILVTETPTNVIPYSAGYFSIKDMAFAGIVMTLIAAVCVSLSILIMGSISGTYGI